MPIPRICELRRRRTCLTSSICAVLFYGLYLSAPIAAGVSQLAERLYETAMEQVGSVTLDESFEAFRSALGADRDFAPAHYEIAKLYMSLDTPMDRQSARNALNNAIRLDSTNVTYQMKLAELLGKQGFWYNSAKKYEEISSAHPGNAESAFMAGYYALKDFEKFIDMQYVDIVEGSFAGEPKTRHLFYWRDFGEKDRVRAISHFEHSIEIDSKLRDAYYYLGLIHFESGNPEGLIHVSRKLLGEVPGDKNALLYIGFGYQTIGEQDAAFRFYDQAIRQMDPDERALMEAVELVATKREKRMLPTMGRDRFVGAHHPWEDSPELSRFWRKRDPLYLTEYNERRLEHYGRVAYANLRFSRRLKSIPGWQTAMGKAYIKFGKYLRRISVRPDFERPDHLETWFYDGFSITFRNWDGFDAWRFDTTRTSGQYVFNHTPSHYADPYRHSKYRIPYQLATFKDRGRLRAELSYVLPKYNVSVTNVDSTIVLENGLFLFDELWNEVYRNRSDLKVRWPELTKTGYPSADSFREDHLVFQRVFRLAPGTYQLVVEMRDRTRRSIGTFQEKRRFLAVDSLLSISDLLLATHIETRTPFPGGRDDLRVVANPLRTYHRSEPAFIYLEVYNLKRDRYGRAEYEISYRIGRPVREEIDPYLFMAERLPQGGVQLEVAFEQESRNRKTGRQARLPIDEDQPPVGVFVTSRDVSPDLFVRGREEEVTYRVRYVFPDEDELASRIRKMGRSKEGVETTITARYEGDREDDFTYLQIDLSQVPAGVHRLSVRVRDMHNGQVVSRDALFRVIE